MGRKAKMRFIFLFIIFTYSIFSQEQKLVKNDLIWYTYNLNLNLSEKVSFFGSYDHRRFIPDRPNQNHTVLLFTYKLNDEWKIGVGYVFFELFLPQTINTPVELVPHEHRPFQQLIRTTKLTDDLTLSTRFQFEQRFFQRIENNKLTDENNFFLRFRLRAGLNYNLFRFFSEKKNIGLYLNNETHVQIGKEVVFNTFDQNRFQFGLSYNINDNFKVNVGYLHWYQETNQFIDNEYLYLSRNILVLNLTNTFKLY